MNKLIIHISGASGSGKTTLGNKLNNNLRMKLLFKILMI
jgi:uridine kinase